MIIYRSTNLFNYKMYIGQTKQPLSIRWYQHKHDMRFKTHFCKALKKYGPECFIIEVLEEVDSIELLDEREIYWIKYYNTFNNGYNETTGGGNNRVLSQKSKEKMSKSQKERL